MLKPFSGEFDKFLKKIKDRENFAFARFSDGELFMLKGERLVLAEDHFVTGDKTGHGVYTQEELKDFDPERDKFYRDKLIETLQYRKDNYYKGLTGVVDEDIAGENSFQFQLDLYGEGDDEHLTYSNVFINNNYPRFIQEVMSELKNREIVFIVNENAKLDGLGLNIVKDFRVGSNCIINDYDKVEEVKNWILDNNIENKVFLFSASTLSNYIIHECFKACDKNTYIDIGSTLNPWMSLQGWQHNRGYLQHWVLGMNNKYGTQEDIWS